MVGVGERKWQGGIEREWARVSEKGREVGGRESGAIEGWGINIGRE
jgi:hypothetical protein